MQRFRQGKRLRFGLGTRLAAAFGSLLVLMALIVGIVYYEFNGIDKLYGEAFMEQIRSTEMIGIVAEQAYVRNMLLNRYLVTRDMNDYLALDRAKTDLDVALSNARDHVTSDRGLAHLVQIKEELDGLTQLQAEVLEAMRREDLVQTNALLARSATLVDELSQSIGRLKEQEMMSAYKQIADLSETARQTLQVILALTGAALLIGTLLAVIMTRRIVRPVRQVAAAAERLAQGDLTGEALSVKHSDEIGQMARSVGTALANLREVLAAARTSAHQVSASADNLNTTSQQAARTAQEMAEAIGQIAGRAQEQTTNATTAGDAMGELQRSVSQIARGAAAQAASVQDSVGGVNRVITEMEAVSEGVVTVIEASARVAEAVDMGNDIIVRTVAGMRELQSAVKATADQVKLLGDDSDRIGEITQVITEIADQTNLLALNAAIEAARAGDAGRGFAVVADEVRKLAERSARSADEIEQLITGIVKGTARVASAMKSGNEQAQTSVGLAEEAGKALAAIQEAVEGTEQSMQMISAAVAQVAESTQSMVSAMNAVSEVTEENAAATEQMAAGAEQVMAAMMKVTEEARESAAGAQQVSAAVEEMSASNDAIVSSSDSLSRTALELQQLVSRFQLDR